MLPICVGSDNSVKGYNLVTPLSIANKTIPDDKDGCEPDKAELALLDLYSGCGGMSTGLCVGSKLSCVNLVTVIFEVIWFYFLVATFKST